MESLTAGAERYEAGRDDVAPGAVSWAERLYGIRRIIIAIRERTGRIKFLNKRMY